MDQLTFAVAEVGLAERWTISPDELVSELNAALKLPGVSNAWTMPIKARIDMLATGIRTPVGLKINGADLKVIQQIAVQAEALAKGDHALATNILYYSLRAFIHEPGSEAGGRMAQVQESDAASGSRAIASPGKIDVDAQVIELSMLRPENLDPRVHFPGIQVVGEASDGNDAVEAAARLHPAVVVMDFALPSMNGAVATRCILKARPETAVLILSMHSEPTYVRTCLDAGARGYLLKNAMDLELVDAVKRVAAGERVLDQRLGSLAERAVILGLLGDLAAIRLDPTYRRLAAGYTLPDGSQRVYLHHIRKTAGTSLFILSLRT